MSPLKHSRRNSTFALALQDEIGLNEWSISLRSAHKNSLELLSSMARKAGKIYGAEIEQNSKNSPAMNRSANGGN
jgi:beta-adrenergic-receptor kinase